MTNAWHLVHSVHSYKLVGINIGNKRFTAIIRASCSPQTVVEQRERNGRLLSVLTFYLTICRLMQTRCQVSKERVEQETVGTAAAESGGGFDVETVSSSAGSVLPLLLWAAFAGARPEAV